MRLPTRINSGQFTISRRRIPQVEPLEDRTLLAGNLFITGAVAGTVNYNLMEYTQDGVLLNSHPVALAPGSSDVYGDARALTVDPSGNVDVFDGTFNPSLATYAPTADTWTYQTYADWSTVNATDYGGVVAYKTFVFATDMATAYQPLNGIIRFDSAGSGTIRFAGGTDFIQVALGQDGLLYCLQGYNGLGAGVQVYNPDTLTLVKTLELGGPDNADIRSIAADSSGQIIASTISGYLCKYDSDGNFVTDIKLRGLLYNLAFDIDGQIAGGDSGGQITITNEALDPVKTIQLPNLWWAFVTFDHYIGTPAEHAATSFEVSGFPSPVTAGTSGIFSVTALDSNGNVASGYTGTIHFTSSDLQAGLPADCAFTSADAGTHQFTATLYTAGTQSITATDTSDNSVSGTQSDITVNPAGASQLVMQSQPSPTATAGQAFATQPVIFEEDAFGNLESSDNSTNVTASLSSGSGPLQGTTTVTLSGGVATFTNLADNKAETIALDFGSGSLTKATFSSITISPAATSSMAVTGFPSPITAGVAGMFTVTAEDAFGNTTPAYLGTVAFTSSDAHALLPGNYAFTSGDAGIHSFSATLEAVGTRSITATDTSNSAITGKQSSIVVNLPPSDDTLFVSGTFHDLLGRAATTQELAGRSAPIDTPRQAFLMPLANSFVFSAEYFTKQVKAYYLKYLGRAADPNGLAGNVAALQGGVSDELVIGSLVGSTEFFNKNGGTNLSFLQAVYQDILGRPIDPTAQAANLAALQAGVSRTAVAMGLLTSGEYRSKLVKSDYSTYMGRSAAAAEVTSGVNALAGGARDETVIAGIVSSLEYFQSLWLGASTDKNWVTSLYQNVLGRSPDTAGLNGNLAGMLNAYAVQRQAEITGLINGNEYRTNEVNGWYQKYLGRAADKIALAANIAALQAGLVTDEQVIAGLVGSTEFFNKSGGTNLSFLQAAYQDILGRAIDPTAQAADLAALQAGVSRTAIATGLLTSSEYRTNLVKGFYSKFLGRSGSSTDVAGWVNGLAAGVTDEQVIAIFLASNEYFLRTRVYP